MAKFLFFHPFPAPMELAQVEPVAKLAKRLSGADAYWIGSWVQMDAQGKVNRIICEWDARDAAAIDGVAKKILQEIPGVPMEGPYPMIKVDGEAYR
jgi:hypothetical protein